MSNSFQDRVNALDQKRQQQRAETRERQELFREIDISRNYSPAKNALCGLWGFGACILFIYTVIYIDDFLEMLKAGRTQGRFALMWMAASFGSPATIWVFIAAMVISEDARDRLLHVVLSFIAGAFIGFVAYMGIYIFI